MAVPYLINGSGGAADKYGVLAAEQIWEVDDEPTAVSYTVAHPLGIPIINRQWREQAHGKWHVTLKFEGVTQATQSKGVVGQPVYEGDSGDAEEPIESFPGITNLTTLFPMQPPTGDGHIIWTQTMNNPAGNAVRNPMFGVDSYKVSEPTWTETSIWWALPSGIYANIDQTFSLPPGPCPALPADSNHPDWPPRNWLLGRVVPRQRGNIWQVQKTWIASGPGGWNGYIYSPSGS